MKKEQKNSSNLFNDEMLNRKINLTSIQGGNQSDKWFGHTDSQLPCGTYDTILNSVKDVEPTTNKADKPEVSIGYTLNP